MFGILLVPGLYSLFQTWRERVKRFFSYLSMTALRRRQLKARGEEGVEEIQKGDEA